MRTPLRGEATSAVFTHYLWILRFLIVFSQMGYSRAMTTTTMADRKVIKMFTMMSMERKTEGDLQQLYSILHNLLFVFVVVLLV